MVWWLAIRAGIALYFCVRVHHARVYVLACAYIYMYVCVHVRVYCSRVKVRGHNLLFNVKDNLPDWVLLLRGQELRDELNKHVQYMSNITLGK